MSNKLKAITARAKKLYKSGRYSKWTDAIKAASKQVVKPVRKKKSVSGVKKKAAKKTRRVASHSDRNSHNVKIKVVSGVGGSEISLRSQFERMIQNALRSIEQLRGSNYSPTMKRKYIKLERSKIAAAKKGLAQVNKIISQKLR